VSSTGPAFQQHKNSFGVYTKTEDKCSGYPIYSNSNMLRRHLLLNDAGRWVIAKIKSCSEETGIMFQYSDGSPFPPTYDSWYYYTGHNGGFIEDTTLMVYSADSPQTNDANIIFEEDETNMINSSDDDTTMLNSADDDDDTNIVNSAEDDTRMVNSAEDDTKMMNSADDDKRMHTTVLSTMHIVIIVTSIVVFLTILIVIVVFCRWFKQRQIARETATVDDNFYYGDEDYEEEYQESAIMDNNYYYAL
jgi:hypothetical protein